jgi:hypothetical protein
MKTVVSKGACNKTPGRDGICLEFFKFNWDNIRYNMQAIFNWMFLDGLITEQQKHGNVLSVPQNDIPTTTAECRQITLLNTEYKILARIKGNRLKPTLCLLHSSQYFEVPGTTIFDALTKVRDCIMYADLTHSLLRILSLQFTTAFDRISHTYLIRILKIYAYSRKFITLIQTMNMLDSPYYQEITILVFRFTSSVAR